MAALSSALLSPAGIGIAISAVTAAATFASVGFGAWERMLGKSKDQVDEVKKASEAAKAAIKGIFEDTAKEATNVQSLIVVLQSEAASRERN